jgi:hypothetical protein
MCRLWRSAAEFGKAFCGTKLQSKGGLFFGLYRRPLFQILHEPHHLTRHPAGNRTQ